MLYVTLAQGLGRTSFLQAAPCSMVTLLTVAPPALSASGDFSAVVNAAFRAGPFCTTASLGATAGFARSNSTE